MKEETHTKAQAWTACRLMIEILDIFFTNVSAPFFFFAAEEIEQYCFVHSMTTASTNY